jgi:hypothetical protein
MQETPEPASIGAPAQIGRRVDGALGRLSKERADA